MPVSASALEFALDILADVGVQSRRMFGGAGLYAQGVMFGLIDDDRIYLKTDDALRAALQAEGAVAWIYSELKGPKASIPWETSYWSMPEAALDEPEMACDWARQALAVAQRIKAVKPVRRKVSGPRGRRRSPTPRP